MSESNPLETQEEAARRIKVALVESAIRSATTLRKYINGAGKGKAVILSMLDNIDVNLAALKK